MGSPGRAQSGRWTDATTGQGLRRSPNRRKSPNRKASAARVACETYLKWCSANQTMAVGPDASRGDDTARAPLQQYGAIDVRAHFRDLACLRSHPFSAVRVT